MNNFKRKNWFISYSWHGKIDC